MMLGCDRSMLSIASSGFRGVLDVSSTSCSASTTCHATIAGELLAHVVLCLQVTALEQTPQRCINYVLHSCKCICCV